MPIRLAFAGIRHFHILAVYRQAEQMAEVEIVSACEEDAVARAAVPETVAVTHDNYLQMLDEIECDAVAVGDYYVKRGQIIIEALKRGKHVISDKPICTSLAELDEIESLAKEKGLAVGCQLDMRNNADFICMKRIIDSGKIGEVHQLNFGGQHPLIYGTRPAWYFEKGKHGGTINDIAIHAVSVIPWLTGQEFDKLVAARCWNAYATEEPHFEDSAQLMATLANGAGVMGDVSYAMPDNHGYTLEQYWRTTVFGTKGIAETSVNIDGVKLACLDSDEVQTIESPKVEPGGYFRSFIAEVTGKGDTQGLTTKEVLKATRTTLLMQQAADMGQRDVSLAR